MQRIAEGDADAFRVISDRHLKPIVNYAYRLLSSHSDAEEVAQETFLRLWTRAARWKPSARLSTWLYRVAHNLAIDRLRKPRPQEVNAEALASDTGRPSQLLARKEDRDRVERALQRLPERQRAAVSLVHLQGFSNPEAADVLDISVEALESLLGRARAQLRKELAPPRRDATGAVT